MYCSGHMNSDIVRYNISLLTAKHEGYMRQEVTEETYLRGPVPGIYFFFFGFFFLTPPALDAPAAPDASIAAVSEAVAALS